MIAFLVVVFAAAMLGPPAPKSHPKPPCPADTVWFHIKTRQEWIGGFPVESIDTTWVIRSGRALQER